MKLFRYEYPTGETPYIMSGVRDSLPFDIEKEKWELTDDLKEADIVPVGCLYLEEEWKELAKRLLEKGCTRKQLLLIMNIFDDCDTYDWLHWYTRFSLFMDQYDFRCVLLTNSLRRWIENDNQQLKIHYDMMWNRQKAYMTETSKHDFHGRVYTYFDCRNNFRLNPIQKIGSLKDRKIALCPNRIMKYNARSGLRRILRLFMQNKSVILGDPTNGIVLEPEDPNMLEIMMNKDNNGGGLWMPVANKYYEQTYISMYVETCTVSNPLYNTVRNPHQSITEKTWDPLIKGHFILPFGYAGIVKDIKNYGFKMPEWIDYSYDDIEYCDRHRFAAYLEEADRLLHLPIDEIERHYIKDFDMLIHNRQVFWSRPYTPLYDQILDRFKSM